MRARSTWSTVALIIVGSVTARAQEPTPPTTFEIGIDPVAVVTAPAGDLVSIRGTQPCTGGYGGTTRVNFGMAAWGTYLFRGDARRTGLDIRGLRFTAGIEDISSEFETDPVGYPAYNDAFGEYTNVDTRFTTLFDLVYARAQVALESALAPTLLLRLGLSGGFPLRAAATQRELIVSPSTAMFLDQSQERTIAEGTGPLDDASVRFGVTAALSYRMRLGHHLFFEPTAELDYGLTQVQPEWSPMILRLGISFGYGFTEPPNAPAPQPEVVELPAPPPTSKPAPFSGSVDVRLHGPNDTVALRRQIVARYVPVVPAVFFGRDSAAMPERYRHTGSSFSDATISPMADEAHRHILDVIGLRLARNPRAVITLTGTSSNDESERERLATARAQTVADVLRTTSGISEGQIRVRSRMSPEVPSNEEYVEGREENRRVEIEASDPSILDPLQIRSVEPATEPREVVFRPVVSVSEPVAEWSLEIPGRAGSATIATGSGEPPDSIVWDLTQADRESMLTQGRASYRLVVTDVRGEKLASVIRDVPLRLDTTVTVASALGRPVNAAEFLLITFEFDQARLKESGRRQIATIIDRISPTSLVTITGYTDNLGDAEHNRLLAQERALAVAQALPKGTRTIVRGTEPLEAPYPNSTPEGRFLNRTVRVLVSDPR